ncbi:alpha/beta hydrolase domain-containing protein [Streptomyces peucetius]|uniref:Alpha/beta hydrolase domain-containing protein n=1 Tax=Streptomyces peucetius TaxID=1950 RepID=A0ABY6IH88_STRPE|nr:alpha/beta hydrolase domain-containing protein [Streptomyces peucetius]UYQ66368.1 alpha/beta hydrolase domain-containing protein [Streptomyces peucetius]
MASPPQGGAEDRLGTPVVTPIGSFGGIRYVQYDGVFEGETSTGRFRVPYRISAPADPHRANGTAVVEPPHFVVGLGALNVYLRRDFLFRQGFVHAGIGWSTIGNRILDPSVPDTFIEGGFAEDGGRVDDEIITDFARALSARSSGARPLVGHVHRQYGTGFSDSSYPLLRLVHSGDATGALDLVLPITTEGFDPQADIAAGRYRGKVLIVNSEADDPANLTDRGIATKRYRFYVVAGSPHIPDPLDAPLDVPFPVRGSTPASFVPALRAHFLQGHDWVRKGSPPPTSTQLRTLSDETIVRDTNGNAITEDRKGRRVPRLPFVELGEARFLTGFIGSYDNVRTVQQLGFSSHRAYVRTFADRLRDYQRAGFILREDARDMFRRARLCAPSTFTETHRDHYTAFVAIQPCPAR